MATPIYSFCRWAALASFDSVQTEIYSLQIDEHKVTAIASPAREQLRDGGY